MDDTTQVLLALEIIIGIFLYFLLSLIALRYLGKLTLWLLKKYYSKE